MRLYASRMQLTVDSDASFLVSPKARSRISGYFRLLNPPMPILKYTHNGAIFIECRAVRSVVISAEGAESQGMFHNSKNPFI